MVAPKLSYRHKNPIHNWHKDKIQINLMKMNIHEETIKRC